MKSFYGLVLALYLFEEFIIQCNANESENKRYFPDELIGEIVAKAGLQTTKEVAKAQMKSAGYAIRRILETHIIVMRDLMVDVHPQMVDFEQEGEMYLIMRSYAKLMSLFEQFGSHARKIYIRYDFMDKHWRREINENIINRYADRLTKFLISTQDDTEIWAEMSNGRRDILFPNVENFIWIGIMKRNKFDLNAIFPRLKSFTLMGSVADTNCLANVKNLEELKINIASIPENQLLNTFRNNQKISSLVLTTDPANSIRRETLRLIENLKNLKTLKVNKMSPDFFTRASDRVYNLSSVTSFEGTFSSLIESNGNFSFDMPNVNDLQLHGYYLDNCISDLFNHFKTVESALLNVVDDLRYNVIECIEQLKYVKEFTSNTFVKSQFPSLEQFFENFDITKSKLNKLSFYIRDSYTFYEEAMRLINYKLGRSNKPTWTISRITFDSRNYAMFKRNE